MPTSTDYFEFMGFPREMALDASELERRYFELSRQYHPDFHANSDEKTRDESLERSSLLNLAYRTLKDPYERARYLVSIEWADMPDEEKKRIPPALLMEVMEMQEKVFDAQSGNGEEAAAARRELEDIEARLKRKMEGLAGELDTLSDEWKSATDEATKREVVKKINLLLNTRSYLRTLLATIDAAVRGGEGVRH